MFMAAQIETFRVAGWPGQHLAHLDHHRYRTVMQYPDLVRDLNPVTILKLRTLRFEARGRIRQSDSMNLSIAGIGFLHCAFKIFSLDGGGNPEDG